MNGALVISLDFELLWGMRDVCPPNHPYRESLEKERLVIPRVLNLFTEYGIEATWAIVGFLFAQNRQELLQYLPKLRPSYTDKNLDPYNDRLGEGEEDDPLHYAPQLIRLIQNTKRQEIATHTFSHYYCLAQGQSRETFAADLDSALALAQKKGIEIRTIIFPRHQYNPDYVDLLLARGITCYRGNERHPVYQVQGGKGNSLPKRLYMYVDSCLNLSGMHLVSWDEVVEESGLCNIPASRFLRPITKATSFFSRQRFRRIKEALESAAVSGKIFHLWWHPHNFGANMEENLCFLREILDCFRDQQRKHGMISLNMLEAAKLAKEKLHY